MLFATSFMVGAAALFGLWAADQPDWAQDALAWIEPSPEPVLVLLVKRRDHVAAVRASVDPERVVAATDDAFALREGRVIATSPEAASEPVNLAGWVDRPIELWTARSARSLRPVRDEEGRGEEGGEPDIAALAAKETLTPTEAMALIEHLGP